MVIAENKFSVLVNALVVAIFDKKYSKMVKQRKVKCYKIKLNMESYLKFDKHNCFLQNKVT